MSSYNFKVNVSCVIKKDSDFLLIKRADDEEVFPGYWGVPGGTVEPTDPTLEDALIRECMEEVGVEIVNVQPISNDINDKGDRGALYIVFKADYKRGELQALDGTAEAKWLGIDEIRSLNLTPKTLEMIEACL
ncbi:MAG: NUDIX domain-containing protein [Candidatus Saccharimonadales bacterium]